MPSKGATKEEKRLYHKQWREKNRIKIRKYNREYNSLYRKKNGYGNEKGWAKRNPIKVHAHMLFKCAIRKGLIKRGNCEVCHKKNAQGHHDDYFKPLEVRWLCTVHHKAHHLNLSPIAKRKKRG